MIIWSGWGFLTALIAALSIGIAIAPSEDLGIPFNVSLAAGLVLGGILNFLLARWLDRRPQRELVDVRTGQRVVWRDRSSLFFIPTRFWTYGLLVLAVLGLVLAPAKLPPPKASSSRAAAPLKSP